MLKQIRTRLVHLILPGLVALMMWGAPAANPAYADCATATSSCTVPT